MSSNTGLTRRHRLPSTRSCQKRRGRALSKNDERPKSGQIDITHAAIVQRVIRYMDSRVGLLSWVSHGTIAKDLGLHYKSVQCHLTAAVLIGELRVRYTNPATAPLRTSAFYPHYTQRTGRLTFTEMLVKEPGRPRRFNYYTLQGCEGHYTGEALEDWQLELIKLCVSQTSANVRKASRIAAEHRLPKPQSKRRPVRRKHNGQTIVMHFAPDDRFPPDNSPPLVDGPAVIAAERAARMAKEAANERVSPPVYGTEPAAPTIPPKGINERADPPGPPPLRGGRATPLANSPTVQTPPNNKPPNPQAWFDLLEKARQNLIRSRAEESERVLGHPAAPEPGRGGMACGHPPVPYVAEPREQSGEPPTTGANQ
jgi:hypothetical protein